MQHYGLPTRLLDITTNPLVALYFACSSEQHEKRYGEVVLLNVEKDSIKWISSDTVSILASMSALSYNDNGGITKNALSNLPKIPDLGVYTSRTEGIIKITTLALKKLIGEVRTEKPGFEERILAQDILSTQFVYAMQNNRRINNQSGAFILFGETLFRSSIYPEGITSSPANNYRVKIKQSKVIVLCIENKKKVLEQLDLLGVNEETMFPEIEDVSKAIVKKL